MDRTTRILHVFGIVLCALLAGLSVLQLAAGGFQWQFMLMAVVSIAVGTDSFRKVRRG